MYAGTILALICCCRTHKPVDYAGVNTRESRYVGARCFIVIVLVVVTGGSNHRHSVPNRGGTGRATNWRSSVDSLPIRIPPGAGVRRQRAAVPRGQGEGCGASNISGGVPALGLQVMMRGGRQLLPRFIHVCIG